MGDMDITEPLILSQGSHNAGSGRGCAMNVIAWELGGSITDYPSTVNVAIANCIQRTNDVLAQLTGNRTVPVEYAARLLDIAHNSIGTDPAREAGDVNPTLSEIQRLAEKTLPPTAYFRWETYFGDMARVINVARGHSDNDTNVAITERIDLFVKMTLHSLDHLVRETRQKHGLTPTNVTAPSVAAVNEALRKMATVA